MVILFVSQGPSLKMPWHSWKVFMMILNLICFFFCLLRNRTVPDLPPKNYFGRFSKEVVDARQQGLQDFLIEWVVNKRDKNSFCRQHFCVNQRLLFILQKQCLCYSNVVCIHMLDLLMKKFIVQDPLSSVQSSFILLPFFKGWIALSTREIALQWISIPFWKPILHYPVDYVLHLKEIKPILYGNSDQLKKSLHPLCLIICPCRICTKVFLNFCWYSWWPVVKSLPSLALFCLVS